MSEIFLSTSVPIAGRGHYFENSDPFLIQFAVRELVKAVIETDKIVWGGHPAITPMIWSICEDMGISYAEKVILYQSLFFKDRYPEENQKFRNVIFTDAIPGNQHQSLLLMRTQMLSRNKLRAAVFIGGMEGIEAEYDLFRTFHPNKKTLIIGAPGGAALDLAKRQTEIEPELLKSIDFAGIFFKHLHPEANTKTMNEDNNG